MEQSTNNAAAFHVDPLPSDGNLSREVERAIERQPLDRVKCVRVYNDCYRCNWWAPPPESAANNRAMRWSTVATHYVRKSKFLVVTVTAGVLTIEEKGTRPAALTAP